MEIDTENIYELLATDQSKGLESAIDNILRSSVHTKEDWDELVSILQTACLETYQKHWLKTYHIMLSLFGMPELLGVDCTIFDKLRLIDQPSNIDQASSRLFDVLVESTRSQFKNGGSTLFFSVDEISSTRSAIIASE